MTKAPRKPKVSKARKILDESRKKQKVEEGPQQTFKSAEFIEDSDGLSEIEAIPAPVEVEAASESVIEASASKTPEYDENAKEIEEAPEIVDEASVIQLEVAESPAETAEVEEAEIVSEDEMPMVEEAEKDNEPPIPVETESAIAQLEIAEIEPSWKRNAKFLSAYLLRRGDRKQGTHSSLVGGRYSVPLEKRSTFYEKYFNEFVRWLNSPTSEPSLFLTERYNGEYFRFFIDIDYDWSDSPPAFLETIEFVKQAVSYSLTYLDDTIYDQIYDNPLEVRPSERTDYKRHLVFPQVIVNYTKALLFAQAIQKYKKISDLGIEFDTKVYEKGSLRMLGSSKKTGLMPGNEKETEFFYMPIDLATGERKKNITYEEFARHTILLDKETTERVEKFAALEDGSVCLPPDERYSSALYVIPKFIHKEASSAAERRARVYEESTYTGPREVSNDSPLHKCILELFGAEVTNSTGLITHCPKWNSLKIAIDKTTFCPLAGREHTSNHAYITLSKRGIQMRCYSTNEAACRNGGEPIPLKDLPKEVVDMIPPEPEIGDVCGGGESDLGDEDEEATAVERPKKIRKKTKSKKKRAAPKEDVGNWAESPALDKGVIEMLYDDEGEPYQQPALTAYLNKFIAYIHQNDTYGFRSTVDRPMEIYRKAVIINKMERFETRNSPFKIWCKNENRREFEHVVFDTSDKKYPDSTLNLFSGYKAKMLDRKVDAAEVEPFLYHLREVICRGHEENYHYYLFWWAWFFQKGRTGIMVILLSELKGTGKNILLELLAEYIIGDKYVAVTDKIDTVVQRFNAIMVEKALIVANELKDISKSGKESSRVEEVIKTLVKDRTTAIEKKGVDPLIVPSTANFHATSQYQVPLKIDRDQRRFVLFDVSSHKKGDHQYFENLAEFVKDHANEIFTYLKQIDLTGWGPEKNLVQTEYTKRAQRAFINPIHQFWYDSGYCDVDFEKTPHPKDPIYQQYAAWCQAKPNKPKVYADTWFGRQIVSMGYTIQKSQTSGERERFVTGKMSDETKALMIDASTTV